MRPALLTEDVAQNMCTTAKTTVLLLRRYCSTLVLTAGLNSGDNYRLCTYFNLQVGVGIRYLEHSGNEETDISTQLALSFAADHT